MTPKNVADTFGRRIAKRYIAVQVTVANRNKQYQWLIEDAAVDLRPLIVHARDREAACGTNLSSLLTRAEEMEQRHIPGQPFHVSSADLTVLRGISEKGESYQPRNFALRMLAGAGSIAGGLLGVASFGPAFAPGVAIFNGPFLSAVQNTLPDFTVNQLNRLNDSAFLANTVVGKQQARVLVIFIPMEYLLTSKQAKQYWKHPESVFDCVDLRLLEAWVDGNFITTVTPQ
jgi:hypothetical protein